MPDVSNPLDPSGAADAVVPPAKPVVAAQSEAAAKAVEATQKAVAEAPAKAAEKKPKPKPVGVAVYQRTVAVDGKLVPMADRHQTPLAGGRQPEPPPVEVPAT